MTSHADVVRWPWAAWGTLVAGVTGVAGMLTNGVIGWPDPPWLGFASGLVAMPIALAGATRPFARFGRTVLGVTMVLSGLVLMVVGLSTAAVIVVGRRPAGTERELYVACLLSTFVACALAFPLRRRLRHWAHIITGTDQAQPPRALEALGHRMTRAIPMDELLLQVVETLHRTLTLSSAEVWTGEARELTLVASLPEQRRRDLSLGDESREVVARAGAQGNASLAIWIPELVSGRADQIVRSVSLRHRGELLGLLVLERPGDASPFTIEEDGVLVDLARQLGLALHNMRLDSALRATVVQLERRNVELRESRARIVAVADDARRDIERNLHDRAQQRLAGLAIDIGVLRSLLDAHPEAVAAQLDQLAADVNGAIDELRELAHGIYPPRLRDRGLVDALTIAVARDGRPITCEAEGIERYAPAIEAAVYFCCLEAIQNAAKHGGEQCTAVVRLTASEAELRFDVIDDGVGFDPASTSTGQGITNMRDRLGAVGGELTVRARPGSGTTITGVLPARPITADFDAGSSTRCRAATPG